MIANLIKEGRDQLSAITDVPQLEAEILLGFSLNKSRAYLFTAQDDSVTSAQEQHFLKLISRRLNGEPIAYIIGKKEFWSLELSVTTDVLIPRPETELLVELALQKLNPEKKLIADLGTGSGAIALALAHERKNWQIIATDISEKALKVAQSNASQLKIPNVIFQKSDWLQQLPPQKYDLIISNPPYIAEEDAHLKNLTFEPLDALQSGKQGLDALQKIISGAKSFLVSGGFLMLEHGCDQAENVQEMLQGSNYNNVTTFKDLAGKARVTIAQL